MFGVIADDKRCLTKISKLLYAITKFATMYNTKKTSKFTKQRLSHVQVCETLR